MKHKTKALVSAIMIVLIGCTGDPAIKNTQPAEKICVLQKIVTTYSSIDLVVTTQYELDASGSAIKSTVLVYGAAGQIKNFEYNAGGKISAIRGEDYLEQYVYDSNVLIEVDYFQKELSNGRKLLQYNDSKQLIKEMYLDPKSVLYGYRVFEYENATSKNAIKVSYHDGQNVLHFTNDYEFDTKVNPMVQMGLGMVNVLYSPGVNNVVKSTYRQITDSPSLKVSLFEFQYNDKGYPVTRSAVEGDGSITDEYSYECK
jgi:hypothetical protein